MNFYSKISALGAVLVMATAFAAADNIQLGSYGTGTPAMGNDNTSVAYVGLPTTTFNISPGSVWHAAGANSSWVSWDPLSGPTGGVQDPNGTYTYTTTFTTIGGFYNGSLTVLADDTTNVLLNGVQIVAPGFVGSDAACTDGTPNCITPYTFYLGTALSSFNSNGLNTLTFGVEQIGHFSQGLDFYGSISAPEPSSLILLGTGLVGSAGALLRRKRA